MPFQVRDIFKQPLSVEELRALAARLPASELFSWKSPTARRLGITAGSRSDGELIELMAGEPRLIRRPLTVSDDTIIAGADLKQLEGLTERGSTRSGAGSN